MKSLPILIFLNIISACLQAQQPLNLGFEKTSVEGTARPRGWLYWQVIPDAPVSMDSSEVREGKFLLGSVVRFSHILRSQVNTFPWLLYYQKSPNF